MIKLSAGLNQDLVGLRRSAVFNVNNSSHIQTRRIDAILPGRHYSVVYLYLLQTGDVTHFNNSDSEISTPTHRTERARLAQLPNHGSRTSLLVRNEHHLCGKRTDGDHAADDPAASHDRHIDSDA